MNQDASLPIKDSACTEVEKPSERIQIYFGNFTHIYKITST